MNFKDRKVWLPVAVLAGFALLSLVLIATASEVEQTPKPTPLMAVRVQAAAPQAVELRVRSQGTVAPRTESALIPEVSGPVVWISDALVSGGFFSADDPLLRIDDRDYRTALSRARATLARAEGELEHARANLQRFDGLAARDIASPAQHDDARRAARVAEASLEEARAGLAQARRDLARTEIHAPYTGRVREKQVDVGQFLSRGVAIATIYATDYVEVRLPIPDHELAYLDLSLFGAQDAGVDAAGSAVQLRARFAGAEHVWRGRVVRTEGEIDPKSRMVHVVARVEDPYAVGDGAGADTGAAARPPLAVGLFVRAEIAGPMVEGVTVVPRSAWRDDGSVLVVDDNNQLQRREVTLLRIDGEQVLLQGDLRTGERICISPVRAFVPGMAVSAIPVAERRS